MLYKSYKKCVNSCVIPILHYGSEISGICKMNNLDRVLDKAARAFLGVHKFCPIASMYKDLDWVTNDCKVKLNVLRFWNRLMLMSDSRLTKMMFNSVYDNPHRGSWCFYVKNLLKTLDMLEIYNSRHICDLQLCKTKLECIDRQSIVNEIGKKPKLRLYKQIMCEKGPETYVKLNLTSGERSMVAQSRMGILPIRIETGRFTNMKINERVCQMCNSGLIEDETHFIFNCTLYDSSRKDFFRKIELKCENFKNMNDLEKLKIFNSQYVRQFAKYLTVIFQERRSHEYN